MAGFFSKLFGGGKKKTSDSPVAELVSETVKGLVEKSGLSLDFEIKSETDETGHSAITVELSGEDEEVLKERKGQLLDAYQLFIKRVVQHHFSEDRTGISVDCGKYREETNQALIERAESLKVIAIEQGKTVYYRALPPKDRKIVHQYLAQDPRIKSRSLGDGLFKKIKIYPAKVSSTTEFDSDKFVEE